MLLIKDLLVFITLSSQRPMEAAVAPNHMNYKGKNPIKTEP